MNTDASQNHLASNIRFLCLLEGSISAAAIKLGINRQQLNKYMNGSSIPSLRTLMKICDHFSVDETEIMLPTEQLKDLVTARRSMPRMPAQLEMMIETVLRANKDAQSDLRRYVGNYFGYSSGVGFSKIYRTFVSIYEQDGLFFTDHLESYRRKGDTISKLYFHRFQGILIAQGDRLSILQIESPDTPRHVLSLVSLYPSDQPRKTVLRGKMVTMSHSGERAIYYSPYVLQFVGDGRPKKRWIRELGVLPTDDPTISPEVTSYMSQNYANQSGTLHPMDPDTMQSNSDR